MSRRTPAVLALALALGSSMAIPSPAPAQQVSADSSLAPSLQPPGAPADSAGAPSPPAPQAPADSSLHRFLGGLSDSTDRYFGLITAPLDTAGLDSSLVAGLAAPWLGVRSSRRLSYGPVYAFNRVDGTLWGASATLGNRAGRWRVRGDLGYAAGSDRALGGGELAFGIRRRDDFWGVRVRGGRRTAGMDRDHDEMRLATIRALVSGSDRQHYLRRDGVSVALSGQGPAWHARLEYRDLLESPLAVTTRWNLARDALETPTNLAAAFGRTRELALEAGARLPGLPLRCQVTQHVSDRALGSDFDYRRVRLGLGGELALGRHASFLPQLVYGRLGGDPVPQACFYLGGSHTLRSLPRATLGGTGQALARLEVMGVDDLLALARLPHPAMFPIQGALFVASGAVWGADPYGGPGTPDVGWPDKAAWLSEAGASLLYRPGIPEDDGYFRLSYAHALGSGSRAARWSVTYSRALDLLRPF